MSAVVVHELYDGAFKSQRVEKNVAAQQAAARKLTLVTHNTTEFPRVPA